MGNINSKSNKKTTISQVISVPKINELKKSSSRGNGIHSNGQSKYDLEAIWEFGRLIPAPPEDLLEPQLSETALYIGKTRYAKRDEEGNAVESAKEMFWRVAYNISAADLLFDPDQELSFQQAKEFYQLMASQKFIPNTPTMLNAGKSMQQLSACFVLPVDDQMLSIAKTLVDMVMIHKSGGGCISADSRVWTTFCGIEPIETIFSRTTIDGRRGIKNGSGVAYDVSDLYIKTISMDPQTGKTGLKSVTHVWKFNVPAKDQIVLKTKDGVTIQTSSWHPFMVLRDTELTEVEAKNLQKGDIILGPERPDNYWPWQDYKTVGSLNIDEDLAWLIGFTLGDGSFGYVPALRQYRVRWFSGTHDVLERVQQILSKFSINVSIQKDKRALLSVATLNQRFVHDLLEACGLEKFGSKDSLIRIPEIIAKSPIEVIRAFIAGLIDSDGYVALDGSPSYTTVSASMAEDLAALMSVLGYRPTIKSKKPYGKGKQITYSIQLCPLPQVNELAADLGKYLFNTLRTKRLRSLSRKQTALSLQFRPWRDLLKKHGLVKDRSVKGGSGVFAKELNIWASHGRIDRNSLLSIVEKLNNINVESAVLLKRIALSGQEVKEVEQAMTPKPYYDLSVEDWNTYAAGKSGMVMIHNTGFSFSRLRPYGDVIQSSGGTTVGPCSFLQAYNDVTSQVKQGGVRRGANMGILHVTHPDVLRFAVMKVDEFSLTNFNISVTVTEEWMEQVKKDSKFVTQEPNWEEIIDELKVAQAIRDVDLKLKKVEDGVLKLYELVRAKEEGEGYNLINPRTGQPVDKLNAKKVFLLITQLAWHYGDPGMIMIDRINKSGANPTPNLGQIEATNPCGEQPLLPYDACTLGSLNVGKFVKDGVIDYQALGEATKLSVHFLDNVLDMNNYPIEEIAKMTRSIRRIGLGVMGFADMLVQLGIGYNTDEGLKVAEEVMEFINQQAKIASIELAKVRGVFPAWQGSIFDSKSPHFLGKELKVRNGAITTIAPTGTIAMLADASSGIEPYFGLSYAKNTIEGKRLFNTNPFFLKVAQDEGFYSEELLEKIEQNHGSVQGIIDVPEKWQKVFVVTHDISPEWHVKVQAAFQAHVDNAISKTINFPHQATVEDVRKTYMMVYELGCKGITIYRDGSREKQVLEVKKENSYYDQLAGGTNFKVGQEGNGHDKSPIAGNQSFQDKDDVMAQQIANTRLWRQRPTILRGRTYKMSTPIGEAFITVNRDESDLPFEVFVAIGKAGMHTNADAEAIGRLISMVLRVSRPNAKEIAQKIVTQLRGIGGSTQIGFGKDRVMSLADAIAKAMAEDLALSTAGESPEPIPLDISLSEEKQGVSPEMYPADPSTNKGQADLCPECGDGTFVFEEGCKKCHSCGYSAC